MDDGDVDKYFDNLKRRILSLDYSGYFTRTFFSEFQYENALDLWVAFRIHGEFPQNPEIGSVSELKAHMYGQKRKTIEEVFKKKHNKEEEEISYDDLEKLEKLSICQSFITSMPTEGLPVPANPLYGHIELAKSINPIKDPDGPGYISSMLDIPLWARFCETCKSFYEIGKDRCEVCRESNPGKELGTQFRGVIRAYSLLEVTVFQGHLDKFRAKTGDSFTERICALYAIQAEPECFRKPSLVDLSICRNCKFNDPCHIGFDPKQASLALLDPDEAIHQLQEKCRSIMGPSYIFPILLYDSSNRVLRYRAVDYLELSDVKAFEALNQIKGIDLRVKQIIDATRQFGARLVKQYQERLSNAVTVILERTWNPSNENDKEEFEKCCHDVLRLTVQPYNEGETAYVWETGESKFVKSITTELMIKGIDGSTDTNEILRRFAETLLFPGDHSVVMTRIDYLGQKLGVMFTFMQPSLGKAKHAVANGEEESRDDQGEDAKLRFLAISREFAPLLFRSLQYEVYNSALKDLEDKFIEKVPRILIEHLPRIMNSVAVAFWSKEQISEGKRVPKYLKALVLSQDGSGLKMKNMAEEEVSAYWEREFGEKHATVILESLPKPRVIQVENADSADIYKKDVQPLRSRLVIPVPLGEDDSQKIPEELHGVFDFFFDISPFVLHRHALDLARELVFIYTQTANASRQKKDILTQSVQSASTGIMARNLSHNIGSHVLTYWARYELADAHKHLVELQKKRKSQSSQGGLESEAMDLASDFEKLIGDSIKLFAYLQYRMDFLAEITTSVPASEMSMDFKLDILDHLIDCATEDSQGVPALLQFIARSEGLNLVHRLLSDVKAGSVRVSIPSGGIGSHALYSIIENFIRNSAKHFRHDQACGPKELFKIEAKLPDEDKWKDKFYEVRLWDLRPRSCGAEILGELVKYIDPDAKEGRFVEATGVVNPQGWGYKEMRACANFLRKRSSSELIQKLSKDEPPLISFLCNDKSYWSHAEILKDKMTWDEKGCVNSHMLGIKFYLLKPKDLAILNADPGHVKANAFEISTVTNLEGEIPHRMLLVSEHDYKSSMISDARLPARVDKVVVGNDLAPETVYDDEFYLARYKSFIQRKLNSDLPTLPRLCFTGGGENYSAITEPGCADYLRANQVNGWLAEGIDCAFYYHHAESVQYERISEIIDNPHVIYFQPLSAKYTSFSKVKHPPDNPLIRRHFLLELIESVLLKIVIVDERASEMAQRQFRAGLSYGAIFRLMNVHIVPIKLNDVRYDKLENDILKLSACSSRKVPDLLTDGSTPTFFVIHQGILDKLEKEKKDSSFKFIKNINSRWKAVDSGRGIPSDFSKRAGLRFIQISALLKMLESFDKHGLAQVLFSSRNPKLDKGSNNNGANQ